MAAMQDGTSRCSNATVSRAQWAGGCTVLVKNEVARNCTYIGQHLLFQQHVPVYSPFILMPGSANTRWVKTASFSCQKIAAFAFIVLAK